jgi:histidinol-phosphatase (PHP family)
MDYVQAAEKLNLISLGFSSHAPVPFETSWCMKPDKLTDYINSVEKIKTLNPEVEIYKGLEVDFVPGVISPNDFKDILDYTVGSIHFIDNLPDGTPWGIDGPHAIFLDGYRKIFHGNIRDAVTRYFELTREMILTACPTVIGHLDKIKIQNVDGNFFSETDSWYQEEIKKTIEVIKTSGAIVEVNTRGIYQKKSDATYPSAWILEILHQKNIPVTISSDAHHPRDLVNQFPEAATLLRNIGFKTISILHQESWKPFSFSDHGIIQ